MNWNLATLNEIDTNARRKPANFYVRRTGGTEHQPVFTCTCSVDESSGSFPEVSLIKEKGRNKVEARDKAVYQIFLRYPLYPLNQPAHVVARVLANNQGHIANNRNTILTQSDDTLYHYRAATGNPVAANINPIIRTDLSKKDVDAHSVRGEKTPQSVDRFVQDKDWMLTKPPSPDTKVYFRSLKENTFGQNFWSGCMVVKVVMTPDPLDKRQISLVDNSSVKTDCIPTSNVLVCLKEGEITLVILDGNFMPIEQSTNIAIQNAGWHFLVDKTDNIIIIRSKARNGPSIKLGLEVNYGNSLLDLFGLEYIQSGDNAGDHKNDRLYYNFPEDSQDDF